MIILQKLNYAKKFWMLKTFCDLNHAILLNENQEKIGYCEEKLVIFVITWQLKITIQGAQKFVSTRSFVRILLHTHSNINEKYRL